MHGFGKKKYFFAPNQGHVGCVATLPRKFWEWVGDWRVTVAASVSIDLPLDIQLKVGMQRLTDELEKQETENQRLSSRNDELVSEVNALKTDPEAIEELLRSRFGYIKKGETFIRLLPKGEPSRD